MQRADPVRDLGFRGRAGLRSRWSRRRAEMVARRVAQPGQDLVGLLAEPGAVRRTATAAVDMRIGVRMCGIAPELARRRRAPPSRGGAPAGRRRAARSCNTGPQGTPASSSTLIQWRSARWSARRRSPSRARRGASAAPRLGRSAGPPATPGGRARGRSAPRWTGRPRDHHVAVLGLEALVGRVLAMARAHGAPAPRGRPASLRWSRS